MDLVKPHLPHYVNLTHSITNELFVAEMKEWKEFLAAFQNRKERGKLPDLKVNKLYKNDFGEYDVSHDIEVINYKFLKLELLSISFT